MKRGEIIAVDLDDVVVETAQNVLDHYNSEYGTDIQLDQYYSTDYERTWQTPDKDTAVRRVNAYLETDEYFNLLPVEEAIQVIRQLKEAYELHIITGRPDFVEEATRQWLERYFPDIFKTVIFSNYYDLSGEKGRPKGNICVELGAKLLIDDHLVHALNASASGIDVFLFGNFPWNQADQLPSNIRSVKDWLEIGKLLLGDYEAG